MMKNASEYMKDHIFELRCGERYKDKTDHRSYIHNLSSCEINIISQLHNSLHNF